jgi:RNA polymerase sigma factor (TIGR02999 family)
LLPLSSATINGLLADWNVGDNAALRAVIPLAYAELRRMAHHFLRQERADHTLQSAALVHEAYLRLEQQGQLKIENREHFLAVCAHLMRHILVDHARARRRAKRNGGERVTLDGLALKSKSLDVIALDDALNELSRLDPQLSRVVELRFFAGLTIEETAHMLGLSPMTVKRNWASAKLWLHREMSKAETT